MDLRPWRTLRLASDLGPAAFIEALRGLVGDGPGLPFAGSVGERGFVITRVNAYRGSHLPLIRGQALPAGGGSAVVLRLTPHRSVIALMAIWLLFLAAFAGIVLAGHALEPARSLLWLVIPAGLASFSWYLMAAVFAADVRWAVAQLSDAAPLRSAGP